MSDPFDLAGAEDDPFDAITPGVGHSVNDFFPEHPPASLAGLQSSDASLLGTPSQQQRRRPFLTQGQQEQQQQQQRQRQQQQLLQQYQQLQRQRGLPAVASTPPASSSTASFMPTATGVGSAVPPVSTGAAGRRGATTPSNHSNSSSMHSSHVSPASSAPRAPLSYSTAPATTLTTSARTHASPHAPPLARAAGTGSPSSSASSLHHQQHQHHHHQQHQHHHQHHLASDTRAAMPNPGFDASAWAHQAIGSTDGAGVGPMALHAGGRHGGVSTNASGSVAQSNYEDDDPPSKRAAAGARGANDADPEMREHVLRYLRDKTEQGYPGPNQTITVLHSRVVQKSYGSEKRFFCPPPAVQLDGERWKSSVHGMPRVFVSMGSIHTQGPHHAVELDPTMYGSAKTLFISDADKRKSFCLHFKVFLSDNAQQGRDVGTFTSRPIKVISKPPKKKQSARTSGELCIEDGSDIALFNRVRSQTAKTRYLVSDTAHGFRIDTSFWSTFRVNLHQQQSASSHSNEPRYISYGSTVVLTCSNSGERMGPFRVRRVEAKNVLADEEQEEQEEDPVSQLQKVALQQVDGSQGFVTLADENCVKMMPSKTKGKSSSLTDASLWTVTSCDRVTYMFCEPQPPHLQTRPVNPVPTVSTVKAMQDMLELYGECFTTHLRVWFGSVPAETFYRCEELLLCHRPPYSKICPSSADGICREPKTVPLLLVRNDGVVYDTGKTYTYEVDHVTIIRALARRRSGKVSDSPALSC